MSKDHSSMWRQVILPSLSLFTSAGTLVCCALPALFVSLGMGAALAGLVSAAPWITFISEHKVVFFPLAGIMLAIAGVVQWKMRNAPCPADALKAKACARLKKASCFILGISVLIYAVGCFFAFFAADLLYG